MKIQRVLNEFRSASPLCDASAMHKGIALLTTYKINKLIVVKYLSNKFNLEFQLLNKIQALTGERLKEASHVLQFRYYLT
jgi:hypothetical protein